MAQVTEIDHHAMSEMEMTSSVSCSCGEHTQIRPKDLPSRFLCPRCGYELVLPKAEAVNIHIHVIENDPVFWMIVFLGWCLILPWLVLGYLSIREDYTQSIMFPLLTLFFCYLSWISDGLRLLTSVTDHRPLWFLCTLGYALALGTLLFTPAYSFWGWVVGIVFFVLGWHISLSTSRAPIRHTVGWFTDLPLSLGGMAAHFGATDIESIRDRLPNSVFMLRSFVDDHNTLEEYFPQDPVSDGVVSETLERTLSVVAKQKGLTMVKLGSASKSVYEVSYIIETTNQQWQAIVAEINQKCRTIVMVPGNTPGVAWEIERLIDNGNFLYKTLLVFPRERAEDADSRWGNLQETFAKHQRTLPAIPKERNWDPVLVRFLSDKGMEWFVARRKRFANKMGRRAYLWSLSMALDELDA